jgi:hypothetical protein
MADEPEVPAPILDTPGITEPPVLDGGTDPSETPQEVEGGDWEKRYKDVQSTYTKTSQELAQIKQQAARYEQALQSDDPEALATLLAEFGWQLPAGNTEETDVPDPVQQTVQEWEAFKAQQAQERQEAQLDQLEKTIDAGIAAEAKALGIELTDRARNLIFNNALATPPGEDGQPNVKQAFADYAAERDEIIKGYRATKTDVPQPPATGQSGTPSVPLGDPKARRALAHEIVNRSYGSA